MPDILGNTSTTTSIAVGGTLTDTLEVKGDHDWVRVTLTAGQKITITLNGITLEDPYVYLRDASGSLLAENDDVSSGTVRDSRLVFTAPTTGTYYIDVGAYAEDYAGSYTLSVQNFTPPPVASYATIATHLTSGYWGGDSHHFNATQGGTITVNLTGLTTSGQELARQALTLWTDVIGITFTEVATGGQITFDDNEEGAFADANWNSAGITTDAHVNVSSQWLTNYGTSINSYAFQTYVHEIGHALGLGHGGYYNSTAEYADDALFANDGWPSTVMSYFDQDESTYFNDLNFSRLFVKTPMLADIRGMITLYGQSTTTRTGDTTYGFNNNSGRSVYDASSGATPGIYAIVDSGGNDTLNYSGYFSDQQIYLTAEMFSNVGGAIGNVTIGFGTLIENALGGEGNDTIVGNVAANALDGRGGDDSISGGEGADTLTGGYGVDLLTGGAGLDTFRDTLIGFNGDRIADFAAGEKIVFTDATLGSFTFSLTGSTLTYSGGSLTLTAVSGTLVASAAAGGGVQLTMQSPVTPPPPPPPIANDVADDFNGDGRSDVLWRRDDGAFTNWLGQSNGGFVSNDANAWQSIPLEWQIAGTGDFNGDGRDDVIWRRADGAVTDWLGQSSGGFVSNDANAWAVIPTSWSIVGTGDFNGDGRDDVVWRRADGAFTNWLGQSNGGFVSNDANAWAVIPTAWQVVGTGDFNGDGRDDILWRRSDGAFTEWLGQSSGGFVSNDANAWAVLPNAWHVVATGDFNGDGRDDIIWRRDDGAFTNWLGQANGGFVSNDANAWAVIPTAWQVVGTGDYNGDGRDDVLWRRDDGAFTEWLGQSNGGFVSNDANAWHSVPNAWQTEPDHPMI